MAQRSRTSAARLPLADRRPMGISTTNGISAWRGMIWTPKPLGRLGWRVDQRQQRNRLRTRRTSDQGSMQTLCARRRPAESEALFYRLPNLMERQSVQSVGDLTHHGSRDVCEHLSIEGRCRSLHTGMSTHNPCLGDIVRELVMPWAFHKGHLHGFRSCRRGIAA